jgi:hypothetical protein
MSHTFTVSGPFPPDYDDLMAGIPHDDLSPVEGQDEPDGGSWPDGVRHYYRDGVSVRAVEVSWEDGEFAVRVNTLSAPEDYDLAFCFVERAAELMGGPVQSEDGQTLPADQLREVYDADWVRNTNRAGLAAVREMVTGEEYHSVQIPGAVRPVHIGRRVWEELADAGPEDELLDRLTEFMRGVQAIDADDFYFASPMTLQHREDPDRQATVAVFAADVDYLFPDVEFLVLAGEKDGDELLFVPYDKLPELLPAGGWEWLDERQTLVDAVPEADWSALRERARPLAVADPLGAKG